MTGPTPGSETSTRAAGLHDAPRWCQILIRVGYITWAVVAVVAIATFDFNLIDPVIQVGALMLITIPIARRIARAEQDRGVFGFVMAAFTAKMLGALLRDFVTNVYYNGQADANEYHTYGKHLASSYRVLDFSPTVGKLSGTGFLRMVTGIVYAIFGTSKFGGFMIFSYFGFIGLLLFWRAFRRAVPDGDARRYALLVLFLPSLLYWPSALGKDAWSLMSLGIASYGIALLLTRRVLLGVGVLLLGVSAVTLLRPHVALVIFCGLVLAALLGKSKSRSPAAPIVRVVVFGALFVMGTVLVSQASTFFGVKTLDQETVDQQLNSAEGRTSKNAGSTFTAVRADSPITFPYATVTVLFRPFPWEAREPTVIVTAAQGAFLMWLTWRSRRRLLSLWRCVRNEPYVAYCIGYLFVFVFAFSAFSNFGILARQRAQVTPVYLVLLCLPERKRRRQRSAGLDNRTKKGAGPYDAGTSADPYAATRRAPGRIPTRAIEHATTEAAVPMAEDTAEGSADQAAAVHRLLDTYPWDGTTPRLQLLGFDVAMRTTDRALARYLAELYAPMAAPGEAAHTLSLYSRTGYPGSERSGPTPAVQYLVHLDAKLVLETTSPAIALAHLLWEANHQVIERTHDAVLVHAAAATHRDVAVVLTGPMGAGKSTIVAALVRDGLGYLTDEVVALEPGTGRVQPYPKPISLGGPSSPVARALEGLRPARTAPMDTYVGEQWLLPPRALRADAVAAPTVARVVIVPVFERGARARLEPLRAPDAVIALAEHTFHLDRDGQRALDALAAIVRRSACFRLVSGDPDDASRCLRSMLERDDTTART